MKKFVLTIIAGALMFTSCFNYLDVKPYVSTIPSTPEEFSALIHKNLNDVDQGSTYLVNNISSISNYDMGGGDDFEASLTQQPGRLLPFYLGSLLNSTAYEPYTNLYKVITDCNIVIGNMKPDNTPLSNEVLSTAYAMRGVAYYQLMRLYCEAPNKEHLNTQLGVPVVTTFNMEARPIRNTLQETISQIETDLQMAVNFHNTNKLYIFTEDVCKAYLARLYWWSEQWDKALSMATSLQSAYPLLSATSYQDMILKPTANLGNHIITAYLRSTETNNSVNLSVWRSSQYRPVSKRFINCFQNGEALTDIRYALSLDKERKLQKPFFCGMRGAELKLIEAECYAHLNQVDNALKALNELRKARITNATSYTLTTLPEALSTEIIKVDAEGKTLSKLMAAILNERRKEFFAEGDRMFELKRNGSPEYYVLYDGLRYNNLKYMYTYPIPEADIRINPAIIQNEGYKEVVSN